MGEREGDVVQRHHQRLVGARQLFENEAALHPVKGRDRLVGEQDRAPVVEGAGHGDALLLPAGQGTGLVAQPVGEADPGEHGAHRVEVGPRRPDEVAQVVRRPIPIEAAHVDVVEHRQGPHQSRRLRHQGDLPGNLRLDEPDQGGLARAGAAEQRHLLARMDHEIDAIQHRPPP